MTITLDASNLNTNTAAGAKLTGTDSVKQAQTAENSTPAKSQTVQTRKFDTVELSDEAQQYLSAEESGTEEQTAEAQLLSESTDTSSEEISSSELYSYTDDQLSELLSKGEITQLQYNTEMAKRGTEE
jgi:membrane-bound ClpP family serine protease